MPLPSCGTFLLITQKTRESLLTRQFAVASDRLCKSRQCVPHPKESKSVAQPSVPRSCSPSCAAAGSKWRECSRHLEIRLPVSGLACYPPCHPERMSRSPERSEGEGSLRSSSQILREARDDKHYLQMSANVRRFLSRNVGIRRECWESCLGCLRKPLQKRLISHRFCKFTAG